MYIHASSASPLESSLSLPTTSSIETSSTTTTTTDKDSTLQYGMNRRLLHHQGIPSQWLQLNHISDESNVVNNNIIHNDNMIIPQASNNTESEIITINHFDDDDYNFHNNNPTSQDENNVVEQDNNSPPLQEYYQQHEEASPITKSTSTSSSTTTPLPTLKLIVIFIIFICDVFAFSTVVSYVPFMVQDFGITQNKTEYGYYAGLIASSYSAASLLSSIALGWLSDRVLGRRKVILMGTLCSCITSLLFGLSINFPMAITVRVVFGLVNGNIGTIKTYLGEITDKTNQARAFSFVGISFAIGSILGPLIGLLARPNIQYPNIMSMTPQIVQNFLNLFPYFLPNLFVATCSFIGFLIAYFKLEETNPRFVKELQDKNQEIITRRNTETNDDYPACREKTNDNSSSSEKLTKAVHSKSTTEIDQTNLEKLNRTEQCSKSPLSSPSTEASPTTSTSTTNATPSALSDLVFEQCIERNKHSCITEKTGNEESNKFREHSLHLMTNEDQPTTCSPRTCSTQSSSSLSYVTQSTKKHHLHTSSSLSLKLRIRKLFKSEIFQTYLPLFTSALNLMIGFSSSAFDEVSPLFSLLPPENGGLGWTNFEIGIQGAVNGVGILVGQLFITPIIAKKLGSVWCFRLGNILILPTVILFPELSWISKWKISEVSTSSLAPTVLMWIFSICLTLLRTFSLNLIFTSLLILINNSVHTSSRGLLNGIVQSFVAFARMMGPVVSSSVFAFTASHSFFFPFDFRFVFLLITMCHVAMIVASVFLKKELNTPKEEMYPSSYEEEEEQDVAILRGHEDNDDEVHQPQLTMHDLAEEHDELLKCSNEEDLELRTMMASRSSKAPALASFSRYSPLHECNNDDHDHYYIHSIMDSSKP
ncbi:hypothetical protein FDP41_003689 [Naegleria fowleri]|uniref:Major facilitator superfamily (MFS) profile domain-containing protein n=1 Tax=Naegleria fowleri TaxID=5763 RepID=A0A6A5BPS9_NAEFO|nr:uncharacterized protein FDP41_003689 [Naegleria fowleri]KAF0977036.1 hypothetical protein FDP41_003689 [Naegleria fowleri]